MDDDIDYGTLFGVTAEDGGGSGEAGEDRLEQRAEAERGSGEAGSDAASGSDGAGSDEAQAGGPERQSGGGMAEGRSELSAARDDEAAQEPSGEQAPPPVQAPDEAQRRAQYEAVIAKAQADAQRTIDEAFARSGLKSPYTGQPITSKAEYDAYKERFDAERREQLLKKSGMSGEEFDQFVQDLPEVRRARQAQEAAEKAQREAREAAARVKIDQQLREIGQLDPSIRSLEDLAKMPAYPRFYELVQRGNTFIDAFRLANFDALTQGAAAGARQAAVNAVRSREHLEQTKTRGAGAVSVPAEVREQYRLFNPDVTDEEIQRHYQKNHKEG